MAGVIRVTVIEEVDSGQFCFVDYSDEPEGLCVDWGRGRELYDNDQFSKLSKKFEDRATEMFLDVILPYYSKYCIQLPAASYPNIRETENQLFQILLRFEEGKYFQSCPEPEMFYWSEIDKTDL